MLRTLYALLALPALLAPACTNTRIVESWKPPGLQPTDIRFEHVVAIALMPDVARQRLVEDTLAKSATRTRVTPAYAIVSREDRADVERLRAVLEQQGIDGAVVVRLMDVNQKETYVPGRTTVVPGGFYGSYGRWGATVYEPGYVRTDQEVMVETSLYDVTAGRLLWSGVSKTLNPSSTRELIAEIAAAARDELRDEGLLP